MDVFVVFVFFVFVLPGRGRVLVDGAGEPS